MTDADRQVPVETAPIRTVAGPIRWRDSFASFAVFNFRLSFIGSIFNGIGGWMARIAIDWLVFELTGSVTYVGITVALQFAPMLLLAPWAGIISDRFPRRRTLMITTGAGTVAVAVLAALVLTGVVALWHVYLIATITGITAAIDAPSRSAFISEVVGTTRLQNAISLNAMVFHFGGLVGPAMSGSLIALVGSGWSIAINACTSSIALIMLTCMRRSELAHVTRQRRATGQFRAAIAYAISKPTIVWPLVLLAFVTVFGMQLPVLLTATAGPDELGTGAAGYGLYSSLAAVGAFLGALITVRRSLLRLRSLVIAVFIFGVVTAFCGLVSMTVMFLAAILGIGAARVAFAVSADAMVQLSARPEIRGRIVSLWVMVFSGGQALGGPIMGWVAQSYGVTTAFLIAGGVPAMVAIVVAIVLARRNRLRLVVSLRSPRRPVHITRLS